MIRYLTGKKVIGKELKPLIIKALNFINKDIKTPLGIKINSYTPRKFNNTSGNITPIPTNQSFIGG